MSKKDVVEKFAGLNIQNNYLLFEKANVDNKTKGGILMTDDAVAKQANNKPTAKLVQKGPESKCSVEVGTWCLFDPVNAKAAFTYRDHTYIITDDSGLLLTTQFPDLIS